MSPVRSIVVDSPMAHVCGLGICMRVEGEGDPLLLINGMTRPLMSWDPFSQALHGRTVVSFDAPGVGGSPTPRRPVSIAGLAAVAVAVLDAAGMGEADVVGFSHGGAVAQQLVHDVPTRVRALVLVSTSCGLGSTPGSRRAAVRGLRRPADANPWPLPDPLGVLWHTLAVSSWSSIPFLGAIKAPTLVVAGSRDGVVPPANARVLARRIPGATLVILPGGHDLQRGDQGRALARIVEDFLPTARASGGMRSFG
jgi:pimeloyl-ACP methyl ester carboxylesterase